MIKKKKESKVKKISFRKLIQVEGCVAERIDHSTKANTTYQMIRHQPK